MDMRPKGFEPSAPASGVLCSIQLSYGRMWFFYHRQWEFGNPGVQFMYQGPKPNW